MWHSAIIFQWNVVPPKHVSSLVLHDEAICDQSQKSSSYKFLQ